jgi:1-acyl-sn-glycerol-3-phosphate acyltransferase
MHTNLLYKLSVQVVRLYARLMFKLDVRFKGELPLGPKLFIANHPSATDPFLIHLLSSKQLSVLVTRNAFAMPLFGYYLRYCGQISVTPGQGWEALNEAKQRIQSGYSVGIFPEGLVSPQSGGSHPPRTGAARLALSTGVPVIPVGIYLPRERNVYLSSTLSGKRTAAYWYFRGPYGITVGEPMQFSGSIEDQNLVQSVAVKMMEEIHKLAEESEQRVRFAPAGARLPAL